jgi:hypothetical protein
MDNVQEVMDGVEKEIETLRSNAIKMVRDRQNLEAILADIVDPANAVDLSEVDKEEIEASVIRLKRRLATVSIDIGTSRDQSQEDALKRVDEKIHDLVTMIECNSQEAFSVAESYRNSCSNGTGSNCSRFEAILLSCTSFDQKVVKERIEDIVKQLNIIKEEEESQNQAVDDKNGDPS